MNKMKIWRESDVNRDILRDKCIAVIGYGAQGKAQALNMRESKLNIIIGGRPGKSFDAALEAGFAVYPVAEAVQKADIIHILLPDEHQGEIFKKDILPFLHAGQTLSFSHGFSIVYREIVPPAGVDVIMVAPKGVATEVRNMFLNGSGVPGLIANHSGSKEGLEIALAMADGMGLTRAGVMECSMRQETVQDLFGEQNILCGGMIDLMIAAFEVLTEAGYPPQMAYIECIQEAKLIIDQIYAKGFKETNRVISNTAEWGEYVNGPRLITPEVKERMRDSLRRIENGEFAREWIAEVKNGAPNLLAKREAFGDHPVEIAGAEVREMFQKKQ